MSDHPLIAHRSLLLGRFCVSFVLFFLSACNTLPVGADQLDRMPQADSLTVKPDSIAGYGRYAALGAADIMYLGKDSQYQSRVILRFALPDTALDSALSAQLILHRKDSTAMTFVIRPCSSAWNSAAVSWRMADSVTHWLTPGGDYWNVALGGGTFTGESLVIELDLGKLDTLVQPSFKQNGVLLFPQDSGFVALYSGYAAATAPRLRIKYSGNAQSVYNSLDDAHLVDTIALGRASAYRIGSGMVFRTYLRFPLECISPAATIAEAELTFLPVVEYRRKDTLRIGVRRLLEPFARAGHNAKFADEADAVCRYVVSPESDSVATFDLRELVQFWTAHPDSNFGLLLVAEPEHSMMFRLGLARTGPAAPTLRLLYVMPPNDRFFH
ncbi:MAG: DNRLRE domain-containing protein [candidate division WOR-3 bacterium]